MADSRFPPPPPPADAYAPRVPHPSHSPAATVPEQRRLQLPQAWPGAVDWPVQVDAGPRGFDPFAGALWVPDPAPQPPCSHSQLPYDPFDDSLHRPPLPPAPQPWPAAATPAPSLRYDLAPSLPLPLPQPPPPPPPRQLPRHASETYAEPMYHHGTPKRRRTEADLAAAAAPSEEEFRRQLASSSLAAAWGDPTLVTGGAAPPPRPALPSPPAVRPGPSPLAQPAALGPAQDPEFELPSAPPPARRRESSPSSWTGASPLAAGAQSSVSRSEKSCKACRVRKVRCSRTWPVCDRCSEKQLECLYGNFVPIDLVKGMHPDSRVAELEARIKMLEHELAARDGSTRTSPHEEELPSASSGGSTSMFSSAMPPSASLTSASPHTLIHTPSSERYPLRSTNSTLPESAPRKEDFSRSAYAVLIRSFREALFAPEDAAGVRRRHVEAVAASARERAARLRVARQAREWTREHRPSQPQSHPLKAHGEERAGPRDELEVESDRFEEMARADAERLERLLELGMPELAENVDWTRMAIWAILDAHIATCSSNVPTLRPFQHPLRQTRLYTRLNELIPAERCTVLAFCAIGVRSTVHVHLLGLRGGPTFAADGKTLAARLDPEEEEDPHVGLKRDLVVRSLREAMMDLYGRLEIAYGEASEEALQATLVLALVQMWNELVPRYSRALIRNAVVQYKELYDRAEALPTLSEVENAQADLFQLYAIPILHIDSATAAYLRSSPTLSDRDLDVYFSPLKVPLYHRFDAKDGPGRLDLREEMRPWLDVERIGHPDHMQLLMGSMVIYSWVAACLRWCAQMSCPQNSRNPLAPRALEALLEHLSTIHATVQFLQHHLVYVTGAPHESCLVGPPEGDRAEHIHLRWLTRLDRETDDATWLVFSLVSERLVREDAGADDMELFGAHVKAEEERLDVRWLQTCESRVRKGCKLAAFYLNFFTISPDPHQTHHLACSLELIPNWTFLATQRFVPADQTPHGAPHYSGLRSKADELTETELDWLERGLEVAQKYHPVAERRLVEMRSYRLAEKKRLELLAADGVPVPVSRAGDVPAPRLGQVSKLSFQQAMKLALTQTVPSWM